MTRILALLGRVGLLGSLIVRGMALHDYAETHAAEIAVFTVGHSGAGVLAALFFILGPFIIACAIVFGVPFILGLLMWPWAARWLRC